MLEIQRLDQRLGEFILTQEDYLHLVFEEAWPKNFHYTTALEGNPLDFAKVREISRLSSGGVVEESPGFPVQEIYNHLFFWIAPETFAPPWGLDDIRNLHFWLMFGTETPIGRGQFRDEEGSIVNSEDDEVFVPCPPEHIEEELEGLLDWVNGRGRAYLPLITATIFFHEFESIHPFLDGNGRVGRVLLHQYLQHNGLPNSHLCTIEEQLLQNPEAYYNVLAWTDHDGEYEVLLDYFSEAVLESYETAVERFSERDLLTGDLDEVKKRLLVKARDHSDWFPSTQAAGWVTGRSQQTILNHLNEMEDQGLIESKGRTRGKRYRYRNPLHEARQQMLAAMDTLREGLAEHLDEAGWEEE